MRQQFWHEQGDGHGIPLYTGLQCSTCTMPAEAPSTSFQFQAIHRDVAGNRRAVLLRSQSPLLMTGNQTQAAMLPGCDLLRTSDSSVGRPFAHVSKLRFLHVLKSFRHVVYRASCFGIPKAKWAFSAHDNAKQHQTLLEDFTKRPEMPYEVSRDKTTRFTV